MIGFLFGNRNAIDKRIGTLGLDVVSVELLTLDSTVTENPIESGSMVSDHVINMPQTLRIEAILSGDTQRKYDEIKQIRAAREPLIVVTGLDVFENMCIESITINRTRATGESLPVAIDLREVVIVRGQVSDIPDASPEVADTASSANNAGRQTANESPPDAPATQVAEEVKGRSVLRSVFS